jgi:glycosyltransferase involved in cell wall biosynthesis
MYMPKVSVIMPAYNCQRYIAESITSVVSQSYEDWELIVVDDCSSDETSLVVSSFLDPRICLIKNKSNLGGAASRNIAISRAKGRFIAFLDADDVWEPDKLEVQLAFMLESGVGFCFSSYKVMYEGLDHCDVIKVPVKVSFSQLLKHNYIGCLTAIYDTSFYGKFYMPLVNKRQDFALWLELLKRFEYAYSSPHVLGAYRVRPGTLSSNKKDAFKYYWRVLRSVGGCGFLGACYNISWYLMIVFVKKRFPKIYSAFVSRF